MLFAILTQLPLVVLKHQFHGRKVDNWSIILWIQRTTVLIQVSYGDMIYKSFHRSYYIMKIFMIITTTIFMILTVRFVFDPPSVGGRFERLNDPSSRHSFSIEEIFHTIYQNHCHTAMKALFFSSRDVSWSSIEYISGIINFTLELWDTQKSIFTHS